MERESDTIVLTAAEWQELLAAAAELDLIRGGRFRARPTGIVFFAAPENAPPGWDGGFPEGSPERPCARVGEAEVTAREGDRVLVRLAVRRWEALRRCGTEGEGGSRSAAAGPEGMARALAGWPEDREWLRRQFRRLRAHARGELLEGM